MGSTMNEERRARWMRAIRKSRRGEPVSPQEHDALLRDGLFRGLDKGAAEEEARYTVRYLLSGEDLSDLPPRGPLEAHNRFAMREEWGAERQTEKLRDMIAASRHDLDYWTALNEIAIRIQEERRWWPAALADWNIAVRRGTWSRPTQPRGKDGRPHYASDRTCGSSTRSPSSSTLGWGRPRPTTSSRRNSTGTSAP